jgi:hypothetical protein
MAKDKAARATLDPALVSALAAQLYGVTLSEARAKQIASELAELEAGARNAPAPPSDAAPAASFRSLLLGASERAA